MGEQTKVPHQSSCSGIYYLVESEVEGLDDIRIKAPFSVDGDWNDIELNHKKWR
jgi:hypothetical protein